MSQVVVTLESARNSGGVPTGAWKRVVEKLLRALIDGTDSHFAMLRFQRGRHALMLEAYACATPSSDVPMLDDESFAIPKRKSDSHWVGDPLHTWGITSYSRGARQGCDLSRCAPAEKAFVAWVKQKAWFPIMV